MYHKQNLLFVTTYFPALISGLMLTASFPDLGLYPLAFIALVPLVISIQSMTPKQSFYAGVTTGFIHYMTLIYWIVPTVTTYGGLNLVLGVSILALLSLYLALYVGVFTFLIKKLDSLPIFLPLAGACLWVGLEYIRTYAFTGFPWGVLGYSQYLNQTLVQIADLTGVLGISFLIVLCNFFLAQLFLFVKPLSTPKRTSCWAMLTIFGYTLVLMTAAWGYGRVRLQEIDTLMHNSSKLKICVIQGNIRQDLKWDKAFKDATLDKYTSLSLEMAKTKPALIIWPETALPFYYGFDIVNSNRVDACIRKAKTNFLLGSPAFERSKEDLRFYNRAYMLNHLALVTAIYDKTHLVPFGEYVPLGNYLTFLGKLTAQAGNFSRGENSFIPLVFNDHKTGVLICFEILFPSLSRDFVKNGADILTTMTNDAWFGRTSAARQHFSFAVLRAVENRRSVVRAANTGISGFIDPCGRVLEETSLFTTAAITQPVPVVKEITFYTRYGDLLAMAALVAICLGFMVKGVNKILRRI
ncbi:MAG: apolipoprotein N-acyltransferase [Desulfobacteraceae bacterium]|nr:apolipoprotein N-acyltransferase [Desulfobacteraceae bacterium]